jgi:hypothetical protein
MIELNLSPKKFSAKVLLLTEDGRTFTCLNQFIVLDLETNQVLNRLPLVGKKFRLLEEADNEKR